MSISRGIRRLLASFYSATGRPSVDPELMIRMLIVGYCFGIRSERRLQGQEYRVDYLPAESNTGMFGGNSN